MNHYVDGIVNFKFLKVQIFKTRIYIYIKDFNPYLKNTIIAVYKILKCYIYILNLFSPF